MSHNSGRSLKGGMSVLIDIVTDDNGRSKRIRKLCNQWKFIAIRE